MRMAHKGKKTQQMSKSRGEGNMNVTACHISWIRIQEQGYISLSE